MMLMEKQRKKNEIRKKMSPPRWGFFAFKIFFLTVEGGVHLNIDSRCAN